VDTTATLQAKYTQRVAVVEAEITKDPKNYDMLIAQAEAYQQWAADVQQATNKVASPDDTPLWLKSLSYFKRAAAVKKLDSATRTNMAIAQFYSGDPGKAIAMAQEIVKADPKFAPVHFNMGVFYTMTGNAAAGAAEYKAYLALDPKGEWAAEAQKRITDLNAQGASTPSSPGTGSLPTTP
jgi:tetratricopeptide (TPR) repeat protein